MSENFLHGVEVIEVDDGTRPIQTVRSSVIGICGTAPDSAPEVKATLKTGVVASNNAQTWTAKLYGALGNQISLHLKDPKAASQSLAISVTGRSIVASLATNSSSVITTTAAQLKTAIEANAAANALVGVANTGASTGASAVVASPRPVYLANGADEPFPLNKPVLVAGNQRLAAKLGSSGTLPDHMAGIFKQTGAVVIVVRVDEGEDDAETLSNIAGGVDTGTGAYTGVWAFLGAESVVGFCPKILCAPGWTNQYDSPVTTKNAVMAELESIAPRLRAVVIGDSPNTNDADAIKVRNLFGNKRVYIVDPWVTISKDGVPTDIPASGYIAGLIARVDNDEGFWVSPSNHEIYGIIGTSRPIDFVLGDSSAQANLLNENDVTTIIRHDGFRLWGNRTCSADPKWAFINKVRTADMINESLLRAHMWAVDRNITRTYFEDVVEGVNNYLSRLKNQGAIAGGRCWADKDLNTADNIAAGRAVFDFDFSTYSPAERVTFRSMMVNDYLEDMV